MEKTKRSPRDAAKAKKKMTREQMQLAIIKKKECDAKALTIVEKLLEPKIDCDWLIENLPNINKCHMEDVIEERAITKVCGYVLCQNPITVTIKQQYHISLRDKKVYDVTKRKNFCSSSCFGASNYLLEQMLTSPLWMRDKEEIPKFKIFSRDKVLSPTAVQKHGEEVDIAIIEQFKKEDADGEKKNDDADEDEKGIKDDKKEDAVGVEDYVFETLKHMRDRQEEKLNKNETASDDKKKESIDVKDDDRKETAVVEKCEPEEKMDDSNRYINVNQMKAEEIKDKSCSEKVISENKIDDDDGIVQYVYSAEEETVSEKPVLTAKCDKTLQIVKDKVEVRQEPAPSQAQQTQEKKIEKPHETDKSKTEKPKSIFRKKRSAEQQKQQPVDINLASRVEASFKEWITDETKVFLYGEESDKQKAIEKIERQDRYTMLCEKLNKLQFEEDQEDAEILEKPVLKPAPHFAVLQEEGKKLDLKVRAFFQGKTEVQEPPPTSSAEKDNDDDAFLPLTDHHAPQIMRRKILLEKLDQVLSDLIRTLAGNNEVYQRTSFNYASFRCTAVKALVNTFSLSAKNIIFKTVEWTLVGLIIVKMLSLLDPWLANLLLSKQANMYVSMILTSYKLDAHYLNLFVASFNPNVNPS